MSKTKCVTKKEMYKKERERNADKTFPNMHILQKETQRWAIGRYVNKNILYLFRSKILKRYRKLRTPYTAHYR